MLKGIEYLGYTCNIILYLIIYLFIRAYLVNLYKKVGTLRAGGAFYNG